MPKLRGRGNPTLSFNANFCDYRPFAGFEAQLDVLRLCLVKSNRTLDSYL
jgi:hypothetical protein